MACREMVASSRPEDRKVIGLRHLYVAGGRPLRRSVSITPSPLRARRPDCTQRSAAPPHRFSHPIRKNRYQNRYQFRDVLPSEKTLIGTEGPIRRHFVDGAA